MPEEILHLKLKPGNKSRAARGHPWAFAGEIEDLPSIDRTADMATLRDGRGRLLGTGLINPKSQLLWRRYSPGPEIPLDEHALLDRLERARAIRPPGEPFQRLVFSDADALPGLIVDRFGDILVVQCLTWGMDRRLEWIARILRETWHPAEIVFRNDGPARKLEGLAQETKTMSGRPLEPRVFEIDGLCYLLDLVDSQKTGFYLDQLPQHRRVASLAQGRRVLDGCCFQGGFALQCARAGAASVLAVDISRSCIEGVKGNAKRNGLSTVVDTEAVNLFDFFSREHGAPWDLIVIDPPPFAPNRKALKGALRGYKELNLRALKNLAPGGLLATYSCSQHADPAAFMEMLRTAGRDARRRVRIIEEVRQPLDHPVILDFPESLYLKGAILEVD
jgi:23S rRNA (cytosine1962-C5)-methyltransferase